MSSSVRCRPVLLGVLLVFCAGGWSSAAQQIGPQDQNTTLSAALSRPAEILGQAVQSAVLTLATELDNRLDTVQSRLDNRLDAVQTLATELDNRLDAVQTGLDNRLDAVQSRLDNRLDAVQTQLDNQLSELFSRLDTIQTERSTAARLPRDCSDLPAGAKSGVHLLQPGLGRSQPPIAAFCDLDTDGGGWTVIQRRADIEPRQDFFLGWQAYKEGFGELDAEFWWGLEHVWALASSRDRRYELRFDLADFEGGERHAVYQGFRVSSERDGYRLTAVNYTGDAGDSIKAPHSGMKFSTRDRDQDTHATVTHSCARSHKAGWWFSACHASNLNGPYLAGQHDSYADGVNWQAWKGYHYSLKTVTIKVRPTKKFV